VIDAATAIRRILAFYKIPPRQIVEVVVDREFLDKPLMAMIERMAPAKFTIGGPEGKAAAAVVGDVRLFVPLAGLVDFAAEKARVEKLIVKEEKDAAATERKLENKAFVEKAPPEIVDENRERLASSRRTIAELQDIVKMLGA
jgi:valyl-tRNA synthetase